MLHLTSEKEKRSRLKKQLKRFELQVSGKPAILGVNVSAVVLRLEVVAG